MLDSAHHLGLRQFLANKYLRLANQPRLLQEVGGMIFQVRAIHELPLLNYFVHSVWKEPALSVRS
jgi:hypothetical protein